MLIRDILEMWLEPMGQVQVWGNDDYRADLDAVNIYSKLQVEKDIQSIKLMSCNQLIFITIAY